MKNLIFIAILFCSATVIFTACKNNPLAGLFGNNEPDSLYSGKKYRLPDLDKTFGKPFVAYADSMTYQGVELGRRLFYDKHLSKDGQKACASCHNLRFALTDSGNRFSANETGLTTRNAPALQNLAWSRFFFWDGRSGNLSEQQKDAFEHELNFRVKDAIPYLQGDTTDVKLFKKAFGRPGNRYRG